MGKDIYEEIKPEKTKAVKEKRTKVKKPMNKESQIITIVIAVILLLTAGIVAYYFLGINSEVIVTYKGGEITRGEYESIYRYMAPNLAYSGYTSDMMPGMVVDQILLNEVLYNEAEGKGYKISEEDQKTLDEQFANQDSISALRAQGIKADILKDFFYKNGVLSSYLEDMEKSLTTKQVKESIIATEGEKADLNLYKTSHILLQFKTDMTDKEKAELLKKANDLLAKAKKGEDFAKLAKDNSEDTSSASDGGAVDMVNNSMFVEPYRKAVMTLKAGQIYGTVVESDYGYHIIKLNSIEKDGRLTNATDLDMYINDYIEGKVKEAFDREDESNKKELEKAAALSTKLNTELGISAAASTAEK